MILQWRSFKIDLASFNKYIKDNFPGTDGIVANPENFEIIESTPLTQEQIDTIIQYYDSLTQANEEAKLDFPNKLFSAIEACKDDILTKNYDSLTILQKKVLMNSSLTEQEEIDLVTIYG